MEIICILACSKTELITKETYPTAKRQCFLIILFLLPFILFSECQGDCLHFQSVPCAYSAAETHQGCRWSIFTGVLKDYLRELPSPLITKQLYEAVLDAMVKSPLKMPPNGCESESGDSSFTVGLLNCLPDVEKVSVLD